MYYLFIIKDRLFISDDSYLYEMLKNIRFMKKENFSYGVSLYYSICDLFDTLSIKYYIKSKWNMKVDGNTFYLNKDEYFIINKSHVLIHSSKHIREILCIFYIYNKNIFVVNFDSNKYFWLKDKFN